MGALSPVLLKVGRADSEQRRKREHNDSFKKKNPEVAKLGDIQQNNYYCHAPFPGALDSVAYKRPRGSQLRAIQVITRNGDRAPCGVLPFENNVTWNCDGPDLYDPSTIPIRVNRVRDEPLSLRSKLWDGNCWRCDVTGRGIAQQHMLGEALGDIYGELLEMSPANLYVRSVDSETIQRSVRGMVRGLLTNAIDAGTVQIATGLSRQEDILLPRLEACPRLAELWSKIRFDAEWEDFKVKYRRLMDQLLDVMSPEDLDWTGDVSINKEDQAATKDLITKGEGARWMTGVPLPTEWEARFDLFLDTIRARTCNGMVLPCSTRDVTRCVTLYQANKLFAAGDWSFHRKYTFEREETAQLYAGPLLALLLKNLRSFNGEVEEPAAERNDQGPTPRGKSVQVYSGEVDTVGGILAALNVTDWAWPPYASNIVLELWKRTETEEILVRTTEGGQVEAELFVRLLYNGRVVRPSFCERDECPLQSFEKHIMEFLMPENLGEACRAHNNDSRKAADNKHSAGGVDGTIDVGRGSDGNAKRGGRNSKRGGGSGNNDRRLSKRAAIEVKR
ncbi:unnamed protein product [Ascophyllum nodosum]